MKYIGVATIAYVTKTRNDNIFISHFPIQIINTNLRKGFKPSIAELISFSILSYDISHKQKKSGNYATLIFKAGLTLQKTLSTLMRYSEPDV